MNRQTRSSPDEADEARVEQLATNAAMWRSFRDSGIGEGSAISADVTWQCEDEGSAALLEIALQPILDRVTIVPRPQAGDPHRAFGVRVQGMKKISLSLAEINSITDQMMEIGALHNAHLASFGFLLPKN